MGHDASSPPQATLLATIYPNPFNPRTTIGYELAAAATVKLAIYDLRGMLVRVLEAGNRPSGRHQAIWDGQDDKGHGAPTGTYFCRLSTSQGSQTRKLTLAR
jgi:flagellar hook assembly protein FlgD